jgi:hypothetical protein
MRGPIRGHRRLESARDLAAVFVPTKSYDRCWEVLQKHRFAVLEGPPEMGKTAIAWMVGLAQLASGWEVIACDVPGQVFERYDNSVRQVFIADDAFGRTEYDVSRGRRWEGDLDRILRLIDAKHWLFGQAGSISWNGRFEASIYRARPPTSQSRRRFWWRPANSRRKRRRLSYTAMLGLVG